MPSRYCFAIPRDQTRPHRFGLATDLQFPQVSNEDGGRPAPLGRTNRKTRVSAGGIHEAHQTVCKPGSGHESRGALFSRVARAADDTLKVGMVLPVTGPGAIVGGYALAGAKIALDRVNKSGGVLGKEVELVTEDDQTTNPGAVLAFSKLAAQPDIVAFLGPVRSTQNTR